jgi:hypothetical protein
VPSITTAQLQQLKQQIDALSPSNHAEAQATLSSVYGILQARIGWGKRSEPQRKAGKLFAVVIRKLTPTFIA